MTPNFTSWCLLCGKDAQDSFAVQNLPRNLRKTISWFTRVKSADKGAPKNICTNCDTFIRFYEKQKEHYQKVQAMFIFALKKNRKPEELIDLRMNFKVSDELQDWKSLGLLDVKVKIEKLDTSLYESFTVDSFEERFHNSETELIVKAEPMSPRAATPVEIIPFLPQFSPQSDLPDKIDNSPPPSPAENSDSDGLSDHFEIVNSKRQKVQDPNKTTKRKYFCDLCDFTICWKSSMSQHMKKQHTLFKGFECKKCPKVYKTRLGLKMHFDRKHRKDFKAPTFPCELCDRRFSSKFLVRSHIKGIHENRREYQCSICSKMFMSRSSLNQHELTHKKTSNLQCSICSRQLSNIYKLKAHTKTHNNVPCYCDICGAKASSAITLKNHKVFVHGTVKLFTCIVCGKQSKRTKDYKEHLIAQHTDLRPYACPYCDRTFNNGPNFVKHKRDSHFEQFIEDKKSFTLKPVILPTIEELHARIRAKYMLINKICLNP